VDYHTGDEHVPLGNLVGLGGPAGPEDRQGRFFVYDSLLSEYAALGFEYGYSVVHGDALVAWEAQFGDFINGAQVVVDQFLVAAEDKWDQASGLVLLLPHGYEGQGPEHSSARLERFLTQSAEQNLQIVNATTSAQYFHLLRRQLLRGRRKPLVVLTPKSLLRSRRSRSPVEELVNDRFREVIDDPAAVDPAAVDPAAVDPPGLDPAHVRRVLLASGKVAYDLMDGRDRAGAPAGVVRVEQLYPWPEEQVAGVLRRYPNASEVFWVQEEPENMGAWSFVHGRLHRLLRDRYQLRHVSRIESGSPAAGSAALHQMEQEDVVARALEGLSA